MMNRACSWVFTLTVLLVAGGAAAAQETEATEAVSAEAQALLEQQEKLGALEAIEQSMAALREEIQSGERDLERARNDEEREGADTAGKSPIHKSPFTGPESPPAEPVLE